MNESLTILPDRRLTFSALLAAPSLRGALEAWRTKHACVIPVALHAATKSVAEPAGIVFWRGTERGVSRWEYVLSSKGKQK